MMPVLTIYKEILESMGLIVHDDGLVSTPSEEGPSPVFIKGMRLALPIESVLRHANWNEVVAFHPLSEDSMLSQSIVLHRLRDCIHIRLTFVATDLLLQLAQLAADTAKHTKLNPRQKEFLSMVPEMDQKAVDAVTSVADVISPVGDHKAVNIFLKRGGNLGGVSYQRTANVSFPIFEEFEEKSEKKGYSICGVSMRKKDKEAIHQLLEYIFPNRDEPTYYSAGSSQSVAPYFDAMIKAYGNVAAQLNAKVELFASHLDNPVELKTNLTWLDKITDLSKFKGQLPHALPHNDGVVDRKAPAGKTTVADRMAEGDLPWDTTNANGSTASTLSDGDKSAERRPMTREEKDREVLNWSASFQPQNNQPSLFGHLNGNNAGTRPAQPSLFGNNNGTSAFATRTVAPTEPGKYPGGIRAAAAARSPFNNDGNFGNNNAGFNFGGGFGSGGGGFGNGI